MSNRRGGPTRACAALAVIRSLQRADAGEGMHGMRGVRGDGQRAFCSLLQPSGRLRRGQRRWKESNRRGREAPLEALSLAPFPPV